MMAGTVIRYLLGCHLHGGPGRPVMESRDQLAQRSWESVSGRPDRERRARRKGSWRRPGQVARVASLQRCEDVRPQVELRGD